MKKGFTLIELVVVVAVIAILTTIIIAAVESTQKNARDAKRISHIKDMQKMVLAYQSANGHLPTEYTIDYSNWDYGCSDETEPVCDGGFLEVLVNESITKFTYEESMDIRDTLGGMFTVGAYRYSYWSDIDCDLDGINDRFAVLYTPCESDKCPTGEVMNSCPGWPWEDGMTNDDSSYIVFMFEE